MRCYNVNRYVYDSSLINSIIYNRDRKEYLRKTRVLNVMHELIEIDGRGMSYKVDNNLRKSPLGKGGQGVVYFC